MMKKIMSLILALVMLISVLPVGVVATGTQQELSQTIEQDDPANMSNDEGVQDPSAQTTLTDGEDTSATTTPVTEQSPSAPVARSVTMAAGARAATDPDDPTAELVHDAGAHAGWTELSGSHSGTTLSNTHSNGRYVLTGDLTLTSVWTIDQTEAGADNVTICLNGFNIKKGTNETTWRLFLVHPGGTLKICNCKETGAIKPKAIKDVSANRNGGSAIRLFQNTSTGAFAEYDITLHMWNVVIDGEGISNSDSGHGGMLYVSAKKANAYLKDCTIKNGNQGYRGGAITHDGGNCTLDNVTIENCKAPYGGAIFFSNNVAGTLRLHNTTIKNCISSGTPNGKLDVEAATHYAPGGGSGAIYLFSGDTHNKATSQAPTNPNDNSKAASLLISGSTQVYNNEGGDVFISSRTLEVRLASPEPHVEIGDLTSDARIGIKLDTQARSENPVAFEQDVDILVKARDGSTLADSNTAWGGSDRRLTVNNDHRFIRWKNSTDKFAYAGTPMTPLTNTTTITAGTSYFLPTDVTLNKGVDLSAATATPMTLCLNGHTLDLSTAKYLAEIGNNITLTICDCTAHLISGVDYNKGYISGKITGATGTGKNLNLEHSGGYYYRSGGAVLVSSGGTLTLNSGAFTGNTATNAAGGAICVASGGVFNMNGGMLLGNQALTSGTVADNRGGAVQVEGTFYMSGGYIYDNTAAKHGGAIHLEQCYDDDDTGGVFNMTGGTIRGNSAPDNGGAIYASEESQLKINVAAGKQVQFIENKSTGTSKTSKPTVTYDSGGAIYMGNKSTTFEVKAVDTSNTAAVLFQGNTAAEYGGALFINSDKVSIANTTFLENAAAKHGSAVYLGKHRDEDASKNNTITINNCAFTKNNVTTEGGGALAVFSTIYEEGNTIVKTNANTVNCTNTLFDENVCRTDGAALYVQNATVTLDTCTIKSNVASNIAGAVAVNCKELQSTCQTDASGRVGHVIIHNTEITDNGCNTAAEGTALYAVKSGKITITGNSYIHHNREGNTAIRIGGVDAEYKTGTLVIGTEGSYTARAASDHKALIDSDMTEEAAAAALTAIVGKGYPVIYEPNCRYRVIYLCEGDFTLNNGVISGKVAPLKAGADLTDEGAVLIGRDNRNQANFTMNGGMITGFNTRGLIIYNGKFTMKGGEISHNKWSGGGSDGAGVRINDSCTMTMTGGRICGNKFTTYASFGSGGGVNCRGDATFMGGEVCHNDAYNGGGILVRGRTVTLGGTLTVHQNFSMSTGGGLCNYMGTLIIQKGATQNVTYYDELTNPNAPTEYNNEQEHPFIYQNVSSRGGGLHCMAESKKTEIYGGTFAGNRAQVQNVYNNAGDPIADKTMGGYGACIQAIGGELNLYGGTITETNACFYQSGAEMTNQRQTGTALHFADTAVVSLLVGGDEKGMTIANRPGGYNHYAIFKSSGAVPLNVSKEYCNWITSTNVKPRVGMSGVGRFAKCLGLVDEGTDEAKFELYKSCFSLAQSSNNPDDRKFEYFAFDTYDLPAPEEDYTYLYLMYEDEAMPTYEIYRNGTEVTDIDVLRHLRDMVAQYKQLKNQYPNDVLSVKVIASYHGPDQLVDTDMYILLEGHSIHTSMYATTDGVDLYCGDMNTDDYDTDDGIGVLRYLKNLPGTTTPNKLHVVEHWQATPNHGVRNNRRYMTSKNIYTDKVRDFDTYNFHRFYAAVTHNNFWARERGLGFNAMFVGSAEVKEHLYNQGVSGVNDGGDGVPNFGCFLWLEHPTKKDAQGNPLRITEPAAFGANASRFAEGAVTYNTYIWRLYDVMLDNDRFDLPKAAKRWVYLAEKNGDNTDYSGITAEAALANCNTFCSDLVICAAPYMVFTNPGAVTYAESGAPNIAKEEDTYIVTTSKYTYTLDYFLDVISKDIPTYQAQTYDWQGVVDFCETFEDDLDSVAVGKILASENTN